MNKWTRKHCRRDKDKILSSSVLAIEEGYDMIDKLQKIDMLDIVRWKPMKKLKR